MTDNDSEIYWDAIAQEEHRAPTDPAVSQQQPVKQKKQATKSRPSSIKSAGTTILTLLGAIKQIASELSSYLPIALLITVPLVGLFITAYLTSHTREIATQGISGLPITHEVQLASARKIANQFAKLTQGMLKKAVEDLLGPPHEIAVIGCAEEITMGYDWEPYYPPSMPLPAKKPAPVPCAGVTVDLTATPPEWKTNQRLYVVLTADLSDPDILHYRKPTSRPGELAGDYFLRLKKFTDGSRGYSTWIRGFYINIEYDNADRLVDATAWAVRWQPPEDFDARSKRLEPWWNENYIGRLVLEKAGLRPIPKPNE